MNLAVQREILLRHLAYYERVFPMRDPAYRRFKSTTIIPRIHRALQKIEEGTFGVCDDCEDPIPAERLAAIPGALRCHACQSSSEKRS